MKSIFNLLFAVGLLFSSLQVFAGTWPDRLSDLPYTDRLHIEDSQLAGFSVFDFRFLNAEQTVDGHSILFYGVENVLAVCDDGLAALNNHYLLIYMDSENQVKHVTNFSQFGCRQ